MKTLFIIFIILLIGCAYIEPIYNIEYSITGNGSADLTYSSYNGSTEQRSNVPLPHSITFNGTYKEFLYISAQLMTGDTITVTIYINGSIYKTATSYGLYSIATSYGVVE